MAGTFTSGDPEFDALVSRVLQDPEEALGEGKEYDLEQLLALRKAINPSRWRGGPAPKDGQVRAVAVSYTNLAEDYLRRFSTVGLVSFLWQMFHEYEVPTEARSWTPAKAASKSAASGPSAASSAGPSGPSAAGEEKLSAALLVAGLEAALAAAREAAGAEEKAAAAKRAADEARTFAQEAEFDEGASAKEIAALKASAKAGEKKATDAAGEAHCALLRAAHMAHAVGQKTGELYPGLAAGGRGLPGAAEALKRYPAPPAPGRLEMPAAAAKNLIKAFLAHHLTFDPSVHVRKSLDEPTLAAVAAEAETARAALARQVLASPAGAEELAAPQDTFFRLTYYVEANLDKLHAVTEALYPERRDHDFLLAPWEYFEGSREEVDRKFQEHVRAYGQETMSAIRLVELGSWSYLSEYSGNRQKAEISNPDTAVLSRILDRHKEDRALGKKLMEQRARKAKARNVAEAGPDAPGLAAYARTAGELGTTPAAQGAKKLISDSEMRLIEAAGGDLYRLEELRALEANKERLAELERAAAARPLSGSEGREAETLRDTIARIEVMLAVPDKAVRVDTHTLGADGVMRHGHFFVEEEPVEGGPDGHAPPGAVPEPDPYAHPAVRRSVMERRQAGAPGERAE